MQKRCADAVRAAAKGLGREGLSDADLKSIDDRLSATMRRLARTDPQWKGYPQDMRVSLAAEQAIADIRAQAQRDAANKVRQIVAIARTHGRVERLQESFRAVPAGHTGTRAEALTEDLRNTGHYISQVHRELAAGMVDTINAAGDKRGAGIGDRFMMMAFDAENPGMTRDIAREIFRNADGATRNEVAQAAARAWLDTVEAGRTRFNAAGGDVGSLDYGYTPQPWSSEHVRRAGYEQFARDVLPFVDRRRYQREDGSAMSDGEVFELLKAAGESIGLEGANKLQPGQFVSPGKRADRGADHRQIHFADGDAYLAAMKAYGRGSMYEAMLSHIRVLARDIGLVERYGPDAAAAMQLQLQQAMKTDGRTKVENLVGGVHLEPMTAWSLIAGKTASPVNERLANAGRTVRDLQVSSKLGAAVVSSLNDVATLVSTTGYNRLPYWGLAWDIARQWGSKEARDWMGAHGMIAENLIGALDRWSGDHLGTRWSGKLANATMRLSLLNAWTDGLRGGFQMVMNAKLSEMGAKPWDSVSAFDRERLVRAGITADDWVILQQAGRETFRGRELLTPQGIRATGLPGAQEAATKLFAFMLNESEHAVINPDLEARAIQSWGGMRAGTPAGELARLVMQFKTFGVSMLTRHWRRAMELSDATGRNGLGSLEGAPLLANRYTYGTAAMVTLLGLGAIVVQANQLRQGKDPVDVTGGHAGAFWLRALAQGGGFGIAGDLFLVSPQHGDDTATALKTLAGPTLGTAGELLFQDLKGNLRRAAEGKDTHAAAETSRTIINNLPGNNLWWVKPMLDHGIVNDLNESMSPGYLARMKERAYRDWGTRWWWAPNDALPARAPNLGAALQR